MTYAGRSMRLVERAYLVPCALVLLHIVAMPLRVNHDCAQFLVAGEILLDGGLPHIDAIDTNPPLIMLLSAVPALLARLLPLHVATIFNLLVLAAAVASAEALRRLLARRELELDARQVATVTFVWAAATLSIDINNQLGQREHLFVLAFVPYAVLRWLRWQGAAPAPTLATALGLATGAAACFRPALARPAGALAAAAGGYALYFLLEPAVREAYFGRWLPFLATGYATFDSSLGEVLRARAFWLALAAAVLPALLVDAARPFAARPFWRLARALAAITLLAAALYVAGAKSWSYRLHPAFGCAALVFGLALAGLLGRLAPSPAWRTPLAATVATGLLLVGAWQPRTFGVFRTIDRDVDRIAASILAHSRPGDPILVLGTGVTPAHPALTMTGRRPATRYLNLFPIPILDALPDAAAERRFLDELRDDVAAHPPAVIFVMRRLNPGVRRSFEMADYLEAKGLLPLLARGYPVDLEEPGFATYVLAR